MATNRDVEDFYELRQGFQGMQDFADAAIRFLDRFGIALQGRRANGTSPSTNGHSKRLPSMLRARVKRHYTKRRQVVEHIDSLPVVAAVVKKRKPTYGEKRLADRRRSATVLEGLDRVEPRPIPQDFRRSIGALVRRGYAKKKGNGYVKTAKVFTVLDRGELAPNAPLRQTYDIEIPPAGDTVKIPEAAKMLRLSDTGVRNLIKAGKLTMRQELRTKRGMHKPMPIMVIDRDEIARYQANQT